MKGPIGKALRAVPVWVWAILAPAVIIGAVQLRTGGGVRVPYVVAGVGSAVETDDHPEGVYFTLDTMTTEPFADTAARVEGHIREYPKMMVIGLDGAALEDSEASERELMATLMTLVRHAENATTIPVILSPTSPSTGSEDSTGARERAARVHEWWRSELCRGGEFRVCVDLAPHAGDRAAIRQAVKSGLEQGLAALGRWRASTQGGR